ncbi:hypothetical protein KL929_001232 [Ogataea haglerorum]|nr:hypothetical protein KL929_001232 [Ogataea haglerorum]
MSEEGQEVEVVQLTVKLPDPIGQIVFQVNPADTVQDVSQTLRLITPTQHHTSFVLTTLGGETLAEDTLIGDITEDSKATVILKEMPYTEKSAREHLQKVREIASLQLPLFYGTLNDISGLSAGASTYKTLELDPVSVKSGASETEEKEQPELSESAKNGIFDAVESVLSVKPSTTPAETPLKLAPALRSLHVSAWTPPSPQRVLKGDLLYLQCQTLEGESFQITAHVTGFFVNSSSAAKFDSSPRKVTSANGKHQRPSRAHSLLTLLKGLSPKFVEQLDVNAKILSEQIQDVYSLPTNALLSNPWLVKNYSLQHPDLGRIEENYIAGGSDAADLFKDWNEEYQGSKELPRSSLPEIFARERLLNKTGFDFTVQAIKGAISVVHGDVAPMNPNDEPSQHVYLRNGIFYSLGVDAAGDFERSGGDEAARVAAVKDLDGVRCLNRLDSSEISHLCTTIVDYCGHRVICQTPVPGIFDEPLSEEEPVSKVIYGSSEAHTQLNADEKLSEKFKKIAEVFHLKPHKAWNLDGSQIKEVVTSMDTKGMKGTDGRDYIIDLYRTTPVDIEFIDKHYTGKEDSYPHRETVLRHEAVEEWWRRQVSLAVKQETERLGEEAKEGEEKATIAVDTSAFVLNPDAFCLTEAPTPELAAELKKDEERVREVSKFVSEILLPELVKDLETSEAYVPIDGGHLSSILHRQGINLRYLGALAQYIEERKAFHKKAEEERLEKAKQEEPKETSDEDDLKNNEQSKLDATPVLNVLDALLSVTLQEMIARGVKHLLRRSCISVPVALVPYVIAHIFNSVLGVVGYLEVEPLLAEMYGSPDILKLSRDQIREQIAKEVYARYRYALPEKWPVHSLYLFKEISRKFGIQWRDRTYGFTGTAPTFTADDVLAVVPVVKDSIYYSRSVDDIWEAGRVKVSKGEPEGIQLLNQAIEVYEQVYGAIHPETAKGYGQLGQICVDLKMGEQASELARKSFRILERTRGIDSYDSVLALSRLALVESANGEHLNAIKLHSRVLQHWLTYHGESHINVVSELSTIAIILQKVQLHVQAAKVFQKAVELSDRYVGDQSQMSGLLRFQWGQSLVTLKQFVPASEQLELAANIFKINLGPNDRSSVEASKWTSQLKEYISVMQKQGKQLKAMEAQMAKKAKKASPLPSKKNKSVSPNPELADKSVDEIMKFIEGEPKKPKKKSKK